MSRSKVIAGYFRSGLAYNRFGQGPRIVVVFQGLLFEKKQFSRDVLTFLKEGMVKDA